MSSKAEAEAVMAHFKFKDLESTGRRMKMDWDTRSLVCWLKLCTTAMVEMTSFQSVVHRREGLAVVDMALNGPVVDSAVKPDPPADSVRQMGDSGPGEAAAPSDSELPRVKIFLASGRPLTVRKAVP